MGERREGSERQSFAIKVIIIVILLLLSFLATILYIYSYPKTKVVIYDQIAGEWEEKDSFMVKRHSPIYDLPDYPKPGHTFSHWLTADGNVFGYFDENGKYIFDSTTKMEEEEFGLYAQYNINQYKVTFNVQVWDDVEGRYVYVQNVQGCEPILADFNTTIMLPTGRDDNGNLLPEFKERAGYRFVGWSKVVQEEGEVSEEDLFRIENTKSFVLGASNIDLYAYWEKATYLVNMHTGIQYHTTDGNPVRDITAITSPSQLLKYNDEKDNFIITNTRSSATSIRYLDSIAEITDSDKWINMTLGLETDGLGYDEYDFKGWYFDKDYMYSTSDWESEVQVKLVNGEEVPYIVISKGGQTETVDATLVEGKYEFNLYSKWERRKYEINFKNATGSTKFVPPMVELYKYDENYGRLYTSSYNLQEAAEYSKDDQMYINCNSTYTLLGWTYNVDRVNDDALWYYKRVQNKNPGQTITEIIEAEKGLKWTASANASYDNINYVHTASEDVTLFAQWANTYTLRLLYEVPTISTDEQTKRIYISFIKGDIIDFPSVEMIAGLDGWTMPYKYFDGWRNSLETYRPSSSNYRYELSSTGTGALSRVTFYAIWEAEEYTITLHGNGGTIGKDADGNPKSEFAFKTRSGGVKDFYLYNHAPQPERKGYVFEGWSTKQWPTNTPLTTMKEDKESIFYSDSRVFISGNLDLYATWTMD